MSHLQVFGCLAYAHVVTQRRNLDDKSLKLRLVGFSHGTRGYRLLDEEIGRILYRHDVVFDEGEFNMRDKRDRKPEPEVVTLRTNSSNPTPPTPVVAPPEMPPAVVEPEAYARHPHQAIMDKAKFIPLTRRMTFSTVTTLQEVSVNLLV